jgi:hypothetical protein
MDADEIEAVRALLSSKPRPIGWAERRQRLDEVGSVWPVADDVTLAPVDLPYLRSGATSHLFPSMVDGNRRAAQPCRMINGGRDERLKTERCLAVGCYTENLSTWTRLGSHRLPHRARMSPVVEPFLRLTGRRDVLLEVTVFRDTRVRNSAVHWLPKQVARNVFRSK